MAQNYFGKTDSRGSTPVTYNFTPLSSAEPFSTSKPYAVGDYVFYEGVLYRCKTDKAAGAWAPTKFEEANLGEHLTEAEKALLTKAEVDGYYDTLTAGSAEQLVATTFEEDNKPYLFRTSGGSIDIGDREFDTLVGGTVAWNQLIPNPTSPLRDTSMIVFNSGTQIIKGHRYIVAFNGKKIDESGNSVNAFWYVNENGGADPYPIAIGTTRIITPTRTAISNGSYNGDNNTWFYIGGISNAIINSFNVIDLTAMFGSTIADYIYSLEQATAGAGVAWFKKLFPKPYYAYNAGELMSVQASSHDMVGFNALDPNNLYQNSGNSVRTTNPIPVIGGQTYELCCDSLEMGTGSRAVYVVEIDADGNETDNASYASTFTSLIVTMKSSTVAVRLDFYTNTGIPLSRVLDSNPCLHLVWDGERNGEYEEYVKHSYPLDSSLTLRGIPKLDASNNLYYDGDTYESDGSVTRKYGIVDLGTLTWAKIETTGDHWRFYTTYDDAKAVSVSTTGNLVCPKYQAINAQQSYGGTNGVAVQPNNTHTVLMICDEAYTDAATFKTAMSGVYLVYELATPTTEEADAFTNPQKVDDFGTEEYVTTGIVPVGHITKYQANLRAKLEMAPNSPDGDGDYIVRQTSGVNEYVELIIPTELPTLPTEDGTYTLKCQVASGTPTKVWVADE